MPAWVARGESFLALDAPLLAGLHFDRALELDRGCAAAEKHKNNLRRLLSTDAAATMTGDDSGSACASHATTAAAGGADRGVTCSHRPNRVSRPPLASDSSVPVCIKGATVAGDADFQNPAPAEDGAVVDNNEKGRPQAPTTVAATPSSSGGEEGGGGGAAGNSEGVGSSFIAAAPAGGGENATARFRWAVGDACENYRAGVVLHQEAFLSSSMEKFLRVLELLEVATAEMKTVAVPQDPEGEQGTGRAEENVGRSCQDGGGGVDCEGSGAGESAGGGAGVKAMPSSSWSSRGGRCGGRCDGAAEEVIRSMRVGCHLNIAAAFLLRKTDFGSAVDHCTRYAIILGLG